MVFSNFGVVTGRGHQTFFCLEKNLSNKHLLLDLKPGPIDKIRPGFTYVVPGTCPLAYHNRQINIVFD